MPSATRENPSRSRRRRRLFDEAFLARLEALHLLAKRTVRGRRGGQRRARRVGDGLEFADHRDYAPGDDIRFIDWPYYARMERLLLRLFHEHSDTDVVVLVDASASMAPGGDRTKLDYALRMAAALAYVAMGGLERVVLATFAEGLARPLHTGRDRGSILAVLDYLAAVEPQGRTHLDRVAGTVLARDTQPGTVLLISDLMDCRDALSDVLARLSGLGADLAVLHVHTPQEAEPAVSGATLLRHAETGQETTVHVTDALRTEYARRWDAFCEGLRRTCLSRGATYVRACTDTPFDQIVLTSLRRAGVVGT